MTEQALRSIALFRNCQASFFEKSSSGSQNHNFNKGKILFLQSEEAKNFYFIRSGWVKLFRETLDGSEAIIDIFTSGHIFGETSIFENNTYPYSTEIVEDAELISIPLSTLKEEIESNTTFAYDMMASMARYRRQQDQEIEHLSVQNASQRIGCFLLRLTKQNELGEVSIQLPYDKMLVASRLGMQPETFSRALKKLKNETGIEIKGATITLNDLEQLTSYSCAACSSEFPCKDLEANASANTTQS